MILPILLSLAFGQSSNPDHLAKVEWMKKNSVAVRSIDPADTDFSDMEAVGNAIGNARVVLLGEQTHGDGATFLAKARLIRYLHERNGFDVLVWESGTFECESMNIALRDGLPPKSVAQTGIFPIWSASPAVMPVFRYALETQKTTKPLEMAGADPQFSTRASSTKFRSELRSYLARYYPALITQELQVALGKVGSLGEASSKTEESRKLVRVPLQALLKELKEHPNPQAPARLASFWIRCLENALIFENLISQPERKAGDPLDDERDVRMGENLVWLANEYHKGKKLIVWAASFHNQFNPGTIETPPGLSYKDFDSMGHTARKTLGKDIYSIGFVAYHGSWGNPFGTPRPVPLMADTSLEGIWRATGHQNAFLDMRPAATSSPVAQPLVAAPLGYSPMKAVWKDVFDGFFFTDTMFAADSEASIPVMYSPARQQGSLAAEVQDKLEEVRKTYVACDLSMRTMTERTIDPPDPKRLTMYPRSGQWPSMLGHKVPSPADFGEVKDQSAYIGDAMYVKGPFSGNLVADGPLTLLVSGGMGDSATIVNQNSSHNFFMGDVAGAIQFDAYATLYVKGSFSGKLLAQSYVGAYIDGDATGSMTLNSSSIIYVMGRVTGQIEGKHAGAKIYIAGRMTKADLAKIKGKTSVILADSDLPPGQHKVEALTVHVLLKEELGQEVIQSLIRSMAFSKADCGW